MMLAGMVQMSQSLHIVEVSNPTWCKIRASVEVQHEALNHNKLLFEKQALGVMDKAPHDGPVGPPSHSARGTQNL